MSGTPQAPDPAESETQPPATDATRTQHLSRRRLFTAAGVSLAGVVGIGAAADYAAGGTIRRAAVKLTAHPTTTASTRGAQAFDVLTSTDRVAAGDIFLTNMGSTAPAPVIADPSGETLWASGGQKSYADCRLQTYLGNPVITWWESPTTGLAAYANGQDVITDLNHNVIATIGAHDGISPDEHEFFLTDRNTALFVSYVKVAKDLSMIGGAKQGSVLNGVFEEIDIATGNVLFHWESLDHVDLKESHAGVPTSADEPYDYFHINSVKPTPDGHYVVSARHTWGVYKINSTTGKIIWRLGGKRSDFHVPSNAKFAWQHDAEFESATSLRMFDNGTDGTTTVSTQSQILWFSLDERRRTATLSHRFTHPDKVSAQAMGNAQRLANGNVMVGWGTAKRISEFTPDGELAFDATLPEVSYRAYRAVWR